MLSILRDIPVTVMKLGGSLFDFPELSGRLVQFLDEQIFARPVIIPGGGRFADEVRRLDNLYNLGETQSHELAVKTLSLTSRLIAGMSSRFQFASSPDQLPEIWNAELLPVLDVTELVLRQSSLPASWEVTSDSIAAWLCSLHQDSQLVLMKSVPFDGTVSLSEAAKLGLVDDHFPTAASGLRQLSWCNLRDANPRLELWKS